MPVTLPTEPANLTIWGTSIYTNEAVRSKYKGDLVMYVREGSHTRVLKVVQGASDDAILAIFAALELAETLKIRGIIELRVPAKAWAMVGHEADWYVRFQVLPPKRGASPVMVKPVKKAQPFTDQWFAEMGLTKKTKSSARKGN